MIIKQPGVYVYLDLEETIVKQVNYIKNRKRFSNHGEAFIMIWNYSFTSTGKLHDKS